MNKQEILNKISNLLDQYEVTKLQLEDHNFKVDSVDWKKIVVDDKAYLENPEKDIWEILNGECIGEQLFTWDSAIRETKKAGKRMPTDKEFDSIKKDDIPNLVYPGYRSTDGSFDNRSVTTLLWSSSESAGDGLSRYLDYGDATVYRDTNTKAYGFSVRCVKN